MTETNDPNLKRIWHTLTYRQHEFLMAKGMAFRDLWIKRLCVKGTTLREKARFDAMVEEFHATEEPTND